MTKINYFFFSSRRRHTRYWRDWSSDVCSSDLDEMFNALSNSTKSQLDSLFLALSYRDASGKSCLDPLKIEDYVSFANCYNGEGRDEEYGSRISQAAASYKDLTSTRAYPPS